MFFEVMQSLLFSLTVNNLFSKVSLMISCSEYDYIEIVCLFLYPVKLTMKVGGSIKGVALDALHNESRNECIKLITNETDMLVELDGISKLEVLIDNPHFTEVIFK
jgi:Rho-binding antiterminator